MSTYICMFIFKLCPRPLQKWKKSVLICFLIHIKPGYLIVSMWTWPISFPRLSRKEGWGATSLPFSRGGRTINTSPHGTQFALCSAMYSTVQWVHGNQDRTLGSGWRSCSPRHTKLNLRPFILSYTMSTQPLGQNTGFGVPFLFFLTKCGIQGFKHWTPN